jgi:hypothetical protein
MNLLVILTNNFRCESTQNAAYFAVELLSLEQSRYVAQGLPKQAFVFGEVGKHGHVE